MNIKFVAGLVVIVCLGFMVAVLRHQVKSGTHRTTLLRKRWIIARTQRQLWKKTHHFIFDFHHHEYQRLFQIEIGAEDLYLLSLSPLVIEDNISWTDYDREQEQSKDD